MSVTFANILVGEGTISIGTSSGNAADIGATQDGCSISWEPNMVDIEVDQFGDAARVVQSRVKVMFKTTIAEAHLSNLSIGWGYAVGASATQPGLQTGWSIGSGGTLNIGLHGVYPEEKYLRVVGYAPGSSAVVTRPRTYTCTRAIQYSASEHALKREENVKVPVDFRILPDIQFTGKEYGTIVDS